VEAELEELRADAASSHQAWKQERTINEELRREIRHQDQVRGCQVQEENGRLYADIRKVLDELFPVWKPRIGCDGDIADAFRQVQAEHDVFKQQAQSANLRREAAEKDLLEARIALNFQKNEVSRLNRELWHGEHSARSDMERRIRKLLEENVDLNVLAGLDADFIKTIRVTATSTTADATWVRDRLRAALAFLDSEYSLRDAEPRGQL
jgi:hypothetical protein